MEDMSDMLKNFSSMMSNGNIPDNIKDTLKNINTNSSSNDVSSSDSEKLNISPEMVNNFMNMLGNKNSESTSDSSSSSSNIDFDTILKMKNIMEKMNSGKDDPRSKLLMSLKPYLKDSRKGKVDQYIQFLSMSKLFETFKSSGGDTKK